MLRTRGRAGLVVDADVMGLVASGVAVTAAAAAGRYHLAAETAVMAGAVVALAC